MKKPPPKKKPVKPIKGQPNSQSQAIMQKMMTDRDKDGM